MKKEFEIENIGAVLYEESFWTGKKTLYVNGKSIYAVSKNEFVYEEEQFVINGNFLKGTYLVHNNQNYEIFAKTMWYEYVLALIPIIFDIIWGNSWDLFLLLPVVSGALGGGICGIMGWLDFILMKLTKNPLFKILISFGLTFVTILILHLIALLMMA